jgi:glycosyltransferase involved in cell wall biosynthesis
MKNVLMLHYSLLFYRIPIYNKLAEQLKGKGINLILWCTSIERQNETIEFETIENRKLNYRNLYSVIKEKKVVNVINFLRMSDPGHLFYIYSVLLAKIMGSRVTFYGHGMNLKYRNSFIIRSGYNIMYLLFDRIILYTPNETELFWPVHHKKISIAYNTLDLMDREKIKPLLSADEFRKKNNIRHTKLVLFCGRIEDRKKLNILIDLFLDNRINGSTGLVIVGAGLSDEDSKKIGKAGNIYYLGPIYERNEISQVFNACDLFCIPGHIGLGLVEGFYWGLPVLTTGLSFHAPEIYYMRNGHNGYLLKDADELMVKINELTSNNNLLEVLSHNARQTYLKEASVNRMLAGFSEALV